MMKKRRLAAGLLAVVLAVLAPMGVSAQGDVGEAIYKARVQSALERLQDMPGADLPEDPVVFDEGPQQDALPGEDGLSDELEFIEDEEFDDEMEAIEQDMLAAVQDIDGTMYSQLNERQRACYNALAGVSIDRILSAARDKNGNRQVKLNITGIQGITMTGQVNGSSFTPDTASAAIRRSVFTDLRLAIVALRYDRPDMVWIGDMSYGYSSVRLSGTQVSITTANYSFALDFNENEKDMRELMIACADVVADEARTLPDRYRKIMLAHDVLVLGNTYNHAAADKTITGIPYEMAHCGYSALVLNDSYQPVCDGYSEAFKIICDRMGIPCAMPSSQTHMWNNVKMDDGRWYNVDVTWDDDDQETINRDYFLIGSQTWVGGQVFSQQSSHVESNPFTPSTNTDPFTLYFPTKRETAYEYLGEDYPAPRFPDVGRDAWYFEYAEDAAALGLMEGDANGWFLPDKNITRAEFAKVVANMMEADLSQYGGAPFIDVDAGAWYAPAVSWIKESGFMKGDTGGTFRPGSPITRQEMCVVIYNLAKQQGMDTPSGSRFADHAHIASWAQEAVYACKGMELVQGDSDGRFLPTNNTMRCAAAKVFVLFADKLASAPGPVPTSVPTPTPSPRPTPTPKPDIDATVYWVPNGSVYHSTSNCASLHNSSTIYSGTVADAQNAGKANPCKVCH